MLSAIAEQVLKVKSCLSCNRHVSVDKLNREMVCTDYFAQNVLFIQLVVVEGEDEEQLW